jgi:hypothetical protein
MGAPVWSTAVQYAVTFEYLSKSPTGPAKAIADYCLSAAPRLDT